MVLGDADVVLSWRNSVEVARFMYRDDPIDPFEHHVWMKSAVVDTPRARFRIAEDESQPIGFMSLTSIDGRHRSCEWGGYLAPTTPRGRGIGEGLLRLGLDMAFGDLDLNRVTVEVLTGNSRAVALYEKVGFVREGLLRQRAWQTTGPRDAFLMSILRSEWNG